MATDQTNLCPLCGHTGTTRLHTVPADEYCLNPDCNVSVRQWPRIRELVAIRDAAVEWHNAKPYSLVQADCANKLWDLARQEAERHERSRTRAEESAD